MWKNVNVAQIFLNGDIVNYYKVTALLLKLLLDISSKCLFSRNVGVYETMYSHVYKGNTLCKFICKYV